MVLALEDTLAWDPRGQFIGHANKLTPEQRPVTTGVVHIILGEPASGRGDDDQKGKAARTPIQYARRG